jgi:hypothetical protein
MTGENLCHPGNHDTVRVYQWNVRGVYTDAGGLRVGMNRTSRGQILPGSEGARLPLSRDSLHGRRAGTGRRGNYGVRPW